MSFAPKTPLTHLSFSNSAIDFPIFKIRFSYFGKWVEQSETYLRGELANRFGEAIHRFLPIL
ncbi:MAG: hypothetical protein QOG23_2248 [Blastocatellia bacterium]|jgi:hypothetical protein|nr:hypothetical protein [Blastocatellia bacterium]